MGAQAAEIIREWARRSENSPEALLRDGHLTHPANRSRNGETRQVPEQDRLEGVIIVPEIPEVIKLLIGLGATPVNDDISKTGNDSKHYRSFRLPETMRITGERYARAGEFKDSAGNPVHGWRPGTIYAPDNTLLMVLNELSGTPTCVVGRTWIQTAELLATNADFPVLPDSTIYARGVVEDFPMGPAWEKVLNGVDQAGQMSFSTVIQSEFKRIIKSVHDEWMRKALEVYSEGSQDLEIAYKQFIEDKLAEFVAEVREPLVDFDSARADRFAEFITANREPTVDAPVVEVTRPLQ